MARDNAASEPDSAGVTFEEPTSVVTTHTLHPQRGVSLRPSEPARTAPLLTPAPPPSRFPPLSEEVTPRRGMTVPPPPRVPIVDDHPQLQAALSADLDADLAAMAEERAQAPRLSMVSPPMQSSHVALFDEDGEVPARRRAAPQSSSGVARVEPQPEVTPRSEETSRPDVGAAPIVFEDRTLTEIEREQRRLPTQFTFSDATNRTKVYVHGGWVAAMVGATFVAAALCWYFLR